jgi:hypothetical protein
MSNSMPRGMMRAARSGRLEGPGRKPSGQLALRSDSSILLRLKEPGVWLGG